MVCTPIQLPGGARGFACGPRQRRRFCACGAVAPLLCDWKVPAKKSGTCDKPICAAHASQPAPGKDLCPEHTAEWARRQAGG
jgi:hypothetical protein